MQSNYNKRFGSNVWITNEVEIRFTEPFRNIVYDYVEGHPGMLRIKATGSNMISYDTPEHAREVYDDMKEEYIETHEVEPEKVPFKVKLTNLINIIWPHKV